MAKTTMEYPSPPPPCAICLRFFVLPDVGQPEGPRATDGDAV